MIPQQTNHPVRPIHDIKQQQITLKISCDKDYIIYVKDQNSLEREIKTTGVALSAKDRKLSNIL